MLQNQFQTNCNTVLQFYESKSIFFVFVSFYVEFYNDSSQHWCPDSRKYIFSVNFGRGHKTMKTVFENYTLYFYFFTILLIGNDKNP